MPNIVFSAKFEQGVYNKDGCDKVEFLISANKGQEPKPLKNIASGGELSRIMLAIKSVLYKDTDADTLIFDEIDTGISGKAADKVGRQLKALSKDNQVICVTHLAQIAAAGDNHLFISKSTNDNNTFTNVKAISGDERVEEIARIMTGNKITENLFASAKELLDSHN
jgi:DNA repair protein RecN (Recombination protein N)